jgi:SH3-like domain-containing protein
MREFSAGSTYLTRVPYESAYPNPLRLSPGDRVEIGDKPGEYAGWLWCTDRHGLSGWIPESFLRSDGTTGVVLIQYDATELTVGAGETVEILSTESGWARCRKPDGQIGWLPLETLEPTR